jgi:transaldolase / glucose-6-phosphate isomerase
MTTENPLKRLGHFGQSVWLDYIRRHLLASTEFQRLLEEDGLDGMTSNPTIFEKAIGGSNDYDEQLAKLVRSGAGVDAIYEGLTTEDIKNAADKLRPIWERSKGLTGYVSYEVLPSLAHDTEGTLKAARHYFELIGRPNLMIKVPGTPEGIPAIEQLISEGHCINVTLMFSMNHYEAVAHAYIRGLQRRLKDGKPIDRIASVASVFVSRVETLVDKRIDEMLKKAPDEGVAALRGTAAVANSKLIYQRFKEIFHGDEFKALADNGAHVQRPLWASTGTKNPAYSDIKYVQDLIGPETVNTMPPATMDAYRDHGDPKATLEAGPDQARDLVKRLKAAGIDLNEVGEELQKEGVDSFVKSFDDLMAVINGRRDALVAGAQDRQTVSAPSVSKEIQAAYARLDKEEFAAKLWHKDTTLWSKDADHQKIIRNALGWLTIPETMVEEAPALTAFADEIRKAGYKDVVLLGMGGSSLCPEVLTQTFFHTDGYPRLHVLDATVPAAIHAVEGRIDITKTLFVVSSKSGGTVETLSHAAYFYDQLAARMDHFAGRNFVAITDPGTGLERLAREKAYRKIFSSPSDIGGRYSALTYFGLVPAALIGIDVAKLLEQAIRMTHSSAAYIRSEQNAGVSLGAALGILYQSGRDKVTFIVSPEIAGFGLWVEQLIAESTGKQGKGLVPICDEPVGPPEVYGKDRIFVYLRLTPEPDPEQDAAVEALAKSGAPVITIAIADKLDLGEEFLRWEIATATAGALIGIDAFDQPNVQESKDNTGRLLKEFSTSHLLPKPTAAATQGILSLFCPDSLKSQLGVSGGIEEMLKAFFKLAKPGDYFALMAYVAPNSTVESEVTKIRLAVRDHLKIATTFGYGPRFLHSTGQLHKGGPNTGLFLQITQDHDDDPPIPGTSYGFATLSQAQYLGDFTSLQNHDRRVIRIHLSGDPSGALSLVRSEIAGALD